MTGYLREILHLLGSERRKLPLLSALFVASSILDLIGIGLVGPYVSLVLDPQTLGRPLETAVRALGLPRDRHALLAALGIALVGIFVAKAIAGIGIQRAILRFSQGNRARLQSALMHAYLHLPYVEFLKRNSAEYVQAIENMAHDFATVLQASLRTLSDIIVSVAVLAMLAWYSPLALALLAGLLLAMVLGYDRFFRRHLREVGRESNLAATRMVRGIHEGMEGLKEIRVLGKERHFHAMVRDSAEAYAGLQTRSQVITVAPRYLLELTLVAFVVLVVVLTSAAGQGPEALFPTLAMFAVASLRLLPAAMSVSQSLVLLRYGRDSVSRLHRDVLAISGLRSEEPSPAEGDVAEPFRSLSLDGVTFTYPEALHPALRDLSIEIRSGDSIGLIGASGSGKTTLVDVLLGLLEPQSGAIRYNGRPLAECLARWRANVAYLPQQVFLIDDTLRRNVALGIDTAHIDAERLEEALRQAQLAELVRELPERADTLIGERGIRLSGGQRQRVALARAFYHRRDVLVLDEATSALDTETEREIVEEIRGLKGHKTLIVIAHRLSTVRHCDRIYRLAEGRIVAAGTYDEVLSG